MRLLTALALSLSVSTAAQAAFTSYDDFSSPATGTPDAAKWTVNGSPSNSGGIVTLNGGDAPDAELHSTSTYALEDVEFTLGAGGQLSALGVGFGLFVPGGSEIILRNDFSGFYELDVFDGAVRHLTGSAVTLTSTDVVTFHWTSTEVSVLINGVTEDSVTANIPSGPMRLIAFAYNGSDRVLKIDSVAVAAIIPEPAGLAMGAAALMGLIRRRK